jgi:hypothetical protein
MNAVSAVNNVKPVSSKANIYKFHILQACILNAARDKLKTRNEIDVTILCL